MPQEQRKFTIITSDIDFTGGEYTGKVPLSIAKKAARVMFAMIEKGVKYSEDPKGNKKFEKFAEYAKYKSTKKIKFSIQEKTNGSTNKILGYEASYEKLKTPKTIERNGVTITVTREIKVKSTK